MLPSVSFSTTSATFFLNNEGVLESERRRFRDLRRLKTNRKVSFKVCFSLLKGGRPDWTFVGCRL